MGDRIELTGLKATGYHGVFPEEKRQGQDFLVDMVCWLDTRPAVSSDDLADTVNYAELAELAHAVIIGPSFDLIEKVAGTIADQVLAGFPLITEVEVTVHKPQAPIPREFADVVVVAHRHREAP